MELLLLRHSTIARRLRLKQRILRIEEIKQIFDDIVSYLNKINSDKRKTDGMDILSAICDELATLNIFRLFDHLILRNHPIFVYIARTFEYLLTKSTHSQIIPMTEQEEDCFYTSSYLITQLCLYQNEPIEVFYGKVPTEIPPVTGKPNPRDKDIGKTSKISDELMKKPNLKILRLPPSAPAARPIEQRQMDITKVLGLKKFLPQFVGESNETPADFPLSEYDQIKLPVKKYQDIFLTKLGFDQLVCAIEDLSQNEYSSHHVKYKVVDRLVRLCSKLNIIDVLLSPIMKCLRSKYYCDVFQTVKPDQIRLTPQQLFFIHQCPRFIVHHGFIQQDKIAGLLSKTLIEATKPIFDKYLLATDISVDSNEDGDRRIMLHAFSCHIEFLYHLSLTSSGRQYFLQSSVIKQLLVTLRQSELISSACSDEHLFNASVGIVAYSIMLLYNLAYEKQIFSMLKQTDLKDICSQLLTAKDITIQFVSKTLLTILNEETIDANNEPTKLKETYINFLESIVIEPKQETRLGIARNIQTKESDIKYRFLTESFLEKLTRDIIHLSTHDYQPDISKYKDVVRRVRVCSKQETNEVESLLDPIIACLTSKYYVDVHKKIALSQSKVASGAKQTSRSLAAKHLFFMRECPEFLMRHAYKRQNEISRLLCKEMLDITITIFQEHLPVTLGSEGIIEADENKDARIEALSCHIKLLNHFALAPVARREFLTTPIIDQILLILEDETLVDNAGHIDNAKIGIVGQCLTLLYNLGFDKQLLSIMRTSNILKICSKLRLVKDKIIQFTSQALTVLFDPKISDDITEPQSLTKTYIEYIDKSVKEPRQPYQGIRLNGVLKSLETFIQNDMVQESIIEEKEGVSSLAKCVCIECLEKPTLGLLKKIRRSSLDIVWRLLSFGPTAAIKLKSIDQLIDHLLTLSNEPSQHIRRSAEGIIWKLGSEEEFRSEQAQKGKEREQRSPEVDDQITTNDQWDDSVPFDLVVSFSNDLNIKSICHRICNRLITKNIKVFIEQQGKHRLELIKKAVAKQKIILVCLSTKYRTSKVCMAEVEYAFKNKCPIIPVIVEANYKTKGWLSHLVGGKKVIDFTQKNFNETILDLIDEIERIKLLD